MKIDQDILDSYLNIVLLIARWQVIWQLFYRKNLIFNYFIKY